MTKTVHYCDGCHKETASVPPITVYASGIGPGAFPVVTVCVKGKEVVSAPSLEFCSAQCLCDWAVAVTDKKI